MQTKSILTSLIDSAKLRRDSKAERRRSAEDTSTSMFALLNCIERLKIVPGNQNTRPATNVFYSFALKIVPIR